MTVYKDPTSDGLREAVLNIIFTHVYDLDDRTNTMTKVREAFDRAAPSDGLRAALMELASEAELVIQTPQLETATEKAFALLHMTPDKICGQVYEHDSGFVEVCAMPVHSRWLNHSGWRPATKEENDLWKKSSHQEATIWQLFQDRYDASDSA